MDESEDMKENDDCVASSQVSGSARMLQVTNRNGGNIALRGLKEESKQRMTGNEIMDDLALFIEKNRHRNDLSISSMKESVDSFNDETVLVPNQESSAVLLVDTSAQLLDGAKEVEKSKIIPNLSEVGD